MKKNKLVLVETEMKSPKGHFLDNLIETTKTFENKLSISWIINKKFNDEKTYIPKNIKIYKSVSTNFFKRKEHKLFYIFEETTLFFLNIINIFYFLIIFKNNYLNFFNALKSNYFILPRYFKSFYSDYKKLGLSKNDHVFFQTARRKDIALINFLIKLENNHPKFHIRVMLPPKLKFKGFFYFLREIDNELRNKRAFVYLFSNYTYKLFLKNSLSQKGILKSNIPWSFYKRKLKKKNHVVGFVGNARRARGFHLLPKLIEILQNKTKSLNYLIQFSKISDDLIEVKKELYDLAKNNKRIKIIEKYCDYKQFRNILKKIDIMPIIHNANEINTITSGTMYSCLSHEIPVVIPKGTNFMKNILKNKSYENAKDLDQYATLINKISRKYRFYLKNVKINSTILRNILEDDPLKKNIY
jgi:hypothetical protein